MLYPCKNWDRAIVRGYGRLTVTVSKGRRKNYLAHRWIYEALHGAIPEGMEVDHLCNNPACVEITHLEMVTGEENRRRKYMRKTHCTNGHALTAHNIRLRADHTRVCLTCHRATNLAYYHRQKELAV